MTGLSEKQEQLEAVWMDPLAANLPLDQWQDLAGTACDPNPFFTPSFLQPYLRAFPAKSVQLMVVRDRSSGDWLLTAPIGRRPAGLAMPVNTAWTSHYAPLGTPLLHPDAQADAIALFLKSAAGSSNTLALPFLPKTSRIAQLALKADGWTAGWSQLVERAGHGSGDLGATQYEAAFHGKRRKEMQRQLRRLEDHGSISVRHLLGKETIAGFEAFLELEAKGWKGRAGTALANTPETAMFSREAIQNLSAWNRVRIDQLWAGDTLVAALVLFLENGRIFSWKIAFDETFARSSPGSQIAIIALRKNLETPGFIKADSLAIPGHPMIGALWRGRVQVGTLLLAKGAVGSALAGLAATDLKVEQSLRKKARALKALID
ncbi:GNAT family N-acetyltransferase [Labrenzia sp. PHM005]|uniref:GNAT family N-acetyltransferase n=1 Tax=Labrenzia sp. PHM005 TaxID=2590016 RepID=UPI00113FD2FF|nr:GNAT family N-acetyltransferase [Labrenzia sp. PHM005]QDG75476.1 GNAT family N-acetyltransferase [Labrenzia sp. PHM005]